MSSINDAYKKVTPELKGLSPLMAVRPTFLDGAKTAGLRDYELTDHLSNVMAVISDRKLSVDTNYDNITDYYSPQVVSYTDYYPFGFPMAERSGNLVGYRFGFNGQEADGEVYGSKQSYTAEFWQYDTRLGRRWNVDPLGKPWESCYATFANNPIWFGDHFGSDTIDVIKNDEDKWIVSQTQIVKGNDIFRIKIGEETHIYTFSEGTYGNRINYLRLESNETETFGIFQLSGTTNTGYIVEPEGPDTKESNKNKRIPNGIYKILYSIGSLWPGYPLIYNENVAKSRGIKIHWGSNRKWSEACLVVASDYSFDDQCKVKFNIINSEEMSKIINKYLGASEYDSSVLNVKGKRRGKNIYETFDRINTSTLNIKKAWNELLY